MRLILITSNLFLGVFVFLPFRPLFPFFRLFLAPRSGPSNAAKEFGENYICKFTDIKHAVVVFRAHGMYLVAANVVLFLLNDI